MRSQFIMTKQKTKKTDNERKMAFESLPTHIKAEMSDEEKKLFLHGEEWPEELFEKLKEFIVT